MFTDVPICTEQLEILRGDITCATSKPALAYTRQIAGDIVLKMVPIAPLHMGRMILGPLCMM